MPFRFTPRVQEGSEEETKRRKGKPRRVSDFMRFSWKENNNAERIFSLLPERDTRCYSALIRGTVMVCVRTLRFVEQMVALQQLPEESIVLHKPALCLCSTPTSTAPTQRPSAFTQTCSTTEWRVSRKRCVTDFLFTIYEIRKVCVHAYTFIHAYSHTHTVLLNIWQGAKSLGQLLNF